MPKFDEGGAGELSSPDQYANVECPCVERRGCQLRASHSPANFIFSQPRPSPGRRPFIVVLFLVVNFFF